MANKSEQSGIWGSRDPLETAINRPRTRALEAVLSFMAHEFRARDFVRPEALDLLEGSLRLEGIDGSLHRAIIAPRLAFLRHIARDWVDTHQDLIVGASAPEGLAQLTVDQALKWGRPNAWLLETFRSRIWDAVQRGVAHALDHLLIAMLWGLSGYSVSENIQFVRLSPEMLSDAGEALGRLLRHDSVDQAHLQRAVEFWEASIETSKGEGLQGFGWFAEVELLDPAIWADLTLRTLRRSGGRIDWSHKVAERAARLPPSETTLAIMDELVRGGIEEWDRRLTMEHAVAALEAATGLEGTPEYERLRTTLLERGATLATNDRA